MEGMSMAKLDKYKRLRYISLEMRKKSKIP